MDAFSWGSGGGLPAPDGLNLLDSHLNCDLDDKTLQFLTGAPSTSLLAAQASEAGPSGSHKRPRDDDFAAWLAGGCEEPEEGGACGAGSGGGDDDSGDECGEGGRKSGGGTRIGKKGKPMTQQALVKATREKARRERLNDCFDELARLCDPSGKMVRTDRVSVVTDAIRVLSQLRVENNQLRQLNKFLEERVGEYERQKAQLLYQQHVMQQIQQQQQQAAAIAAAGAGQQQQQQPAAATAVAGGQQAQAQTQAPLQGAASGEIQPAAPAPTPALPAPPAGLVAGMAVPGMPALGAAVPGAVPAAAAAGLPGMLMQLPAAAAAQQLPLLGVKQEPAASAGLGAGLLLPGMAGLPSALPPGAPPVSWLPAASLDVSQDQKLRPPAA